MSKITATHDVTVTNSLATTGVICFTDQAVGEVYISADCTGITTLTWYTSDTYDGTYLIAYDVGTAGVQTVGVSRAYRIPVELCGAAYLKAVSSIATGTITVTLKS